ncbi:MAG: hypothetical protein P8Z68_07900 [Kineosporiaceae bacterium]
MSAWGKRAGRELQNWAESVGFVYDPDDRGWAAFAGYALGTPGAPVAVASGFSQGFQVVLAQVSGQGRGSRGAHIRTAATAPRPLPSFTARPRPREERREGGPAALRTGIAEIDAAYLLEAPDPLAASALLQPPATDRILELDGAPLAAQGHWLATWRPGRFSPAEEGQLVAALAWLGQEFSRALATAP